MAFCVEANQRIEYPTKTVSRSYGDDEVELTVYVFNFPMDESDARYNASQHEYYSGPGRTFARCSVRHTKRRTAFYVRSGWDI